MKNFNGQALLKVTERFPDDFTTIHQLKTTLGTTYSYVSRKHIDHYLDEFNYRINRLVSKATIFHGLIFRMVNQEPYYWSQIRSR